MLEKTKLMELVEMLEGTAEEIEAEVAAGNDPFDKCAKVMATGNEIANTAHHMIICVLERGG